MDAIFFKHANANVDIVDPGKVSRRVLAYGGKLMMVEVSFEKGGRGTVHSHMHEQATYCMEGEFTFTVGAESMNLKPGDTVFLPSWKEHGTLALSRGRLLDVFTPQREDFLEAR